MFVSVADTRPSAGVAIPDGALAEQGEQGAVAARAALALLTERARPITSSRSRLLPVVPPLAGLFPEGGLGQHDRRHR
jgi:hypothetical protein